MTEPDQVPPAPGHDPEALADILTEQEDRQLMAAVILPNEGALAPDQRKEVQNAVRAYAAKHELGDAQIARQVGMGATTVFHALRSSAQLGPSKAGKLDDRLRELNMWMEADARRRATRPHEQFVRTKVAKKIIDAAKVAIADGSIVLVVGPTGVGKTMVGHYVYEDTTGALYLRLGRHLRTYTRLRSRIAALLKVSEGRRMQKSLRRLHTEERIFETLRDSNRLLILDEGHQISDDGLGFLRDLYDETHIPMLILCTVDLWERIQAEADEDHGQMHSRVGMCVTLAGSDLEASTDNPAIFSRGEIRQLYQSAKVKLAADAVEYLHDVANALGHGSLRRCAELMKRTIRVARQQAGGGEVSVTITAELLRKTEAKYMRSATGRKAVETRRALAVAG